MTMPYWTRRAGALVAPLMMVVAGCESSSDGAGATGGATSTSSVTGSSSTGLSCQSPLQACGAECVFVASDALYKLYVGAEMQVLPRLGVGERSPIFAILAPESFARWSWFVRLAAPARTDSEWAGLARLEIARGPADGRQVELAEAQRIADETALRLPRFAPSRARRAVAAEPPADWRARGPPAALARRSASRAAPPHRVDRSR
ncbi:MAG: hypothetical protein U0414_38190 [Polyangiaceae bacterium]